MNDPITLAKRLEAHLGHNLEVYGDFVDCLSCSVGIAQANAAAYENKFKGHDGHECYITFYYDKDKSLVDITVECCDLVLISAETDGEFQCPRCAETFSGVDFEEMACINDHHMCRNCLESGKENHEH